MRIPLLDRDVGRRSLVWGGVASAAITVFYVGVLGSVAGLRHLADQAAADWYWLALIIPGFGLQVALLSELRRRHTAGLAAAGAGTASSAAGMVACCAHHLVEVAPLVGAAGLAGILEDWKPWLLTAGVAITYGMVARSWRHLAGAGVEEVECVAH